MDHAVFAGRLDRLTGHGILADWAARVAEWRRLSEERRRLAELDPRLLRDIGVDSAEAATEAARPFWDMPAGRW